MFSIFLLLAFESAREMYIKVNTKMNSTGKRDTIGISVMDLCALSNASACFSLLSLALCGVRAHLFLNICSRSISREEGF